MSPTIENKNLQSCLPMSLRSHIKYSFHVFGHALKAFERDKRLGVASTFITFLMFSYRDQTLELMFHLLLEKQCFNLIDRLPMFFLKFSIISSLTEQAIERMTLKEVKHNNQDESLGKSEKLHYM